MSNNKSKNVKLPQELLELLEKRGITKNPGEALLTLCKEYEKIEALAKCVDKTADLSKVSVFEVLTSYMESGKKRYEDLQTSINDLRTMFKGLEMFFMKVKQ
jgi:hypothetical protein